MINGASELFVALYGEGGLAARMALGTNELPEGACVEICAIAEVDGSGGSVSFFHGTEKFRFL